MIPLTRDFKPKGRRHSVDDNPGHRIQTVITGGELTNVINSTKSLKPSSSITDSLSNPSNHVPVESEPLEPGSISLNLEPSDQVASVLGSTQLVDAERWRKHSRKFTQTKPIISVDFETYYSGDYSVAKLGNWAYCHHPEFNAYLVAISDGVFTCVVPPEEFPWETIAGLEWVSHNRGFDKSVWERLKELKLISHNQGGPSQWHCTAAASAYLQLPRSLSGAVKDVFGMELDKTVRSKTKGLKYEDEIIRSI